MARASPLSNAPAARPPHASMRFNLQAALAQATSGIAAPAVGTNGRPMRTWSPTCVTPSRPWSSGSSNRSDHDTSAALIDLISPPFRVTQPLPETIAPAKTKIVTSPAVLQSCHSEPFFHTPSPGSAPRQSGPSFHGMASIKSTGSNIRYLKTSDTSGSLR